LLKHLPRVGRFLAAVCLLAVGTLTGCTPPDALDASLSEITRPYRFDLVGWELGALAGEGLLLVFGQTQADGTARVTEYFDNAARLEELAGEIAAVEAGSRPGDPEGLRQEYAELEVANARLVLTVERTLESQLREAFTEQGITNPFGRTSLGFPPVNFHLAPPPHLLVVSPRDKIESLREVTLLPQLTVAEMEAIEAAVTALGYSALVTDLGGISTYPSFVTSGTDLHFTIEVAAEEWLHQYLAFTPLGFGYLLDVSGLRRDYEIAQMNETVVGIASKEIGDMVYARYYASGEEAPEEPAGGFDFNAAMRETRLAVDAYLAAGEVAAAESYMEVRRRYINANGYYIRKLNQAYFAFHGTYADSPTSVSPIGEDFRELRQQSDSLKAFLDTAAAMTDLADLAGAIR
jgi:hypothetical protein